MSRCVITRRLPGDAVERLAHAHEVEVWPGALPPTPDELRELVGGAEGLLCLLTDTVDEALLAAAPRLRVVSNYAVGTDNVDLAACAARGIPVGRTPDALTGATADLTLALILAAARRLPEAARAVADGEWRTWEPARWLGLELDGATLLVVGPGRIGRAVAARAEAFGMRVLLAGRGDPLPLQQADVVTLHCPLTPQTRHLIDAAALERMKPGALLVNTARGPIVDSAALRRALHDGAIGGAALDVTDPEPLPPDDPLLDAPNLLVLPHVGSATTRARARMTDIAVENLLAGLAGEPLPHPAAS
jgi:phosphoglycerate dehydrogenase-like enzyme